MKTFYLLTTLILAPLIICGCSLNQSRSIEAEHKQQEYRMEQNFHKPRTFQEKTARQRVNQDGFNGDFSIPLLKK